MYSPALTAGCGYLPTFKQPESATLEVTVVPKEDDYAWRGGDPQVPLCSRVR